MKTVFLAGCLAATLSLPGAHTYASEAVPAGIRQQLKLIEEKWAGKDADAIHRQVFMADAVVSGEGMPAPARGGAALRQLLAGMVADAKSVKLVVDGGRALGPAATLTWMTWIVTPRAEGSPEMRMQSLTVWNKTPEGWKIAADMFAQGDLTKK